MLSIPANPPPVARLLVTHVMCVPRVRQIDGTPPRIVMCDIGGILKSRFDSRGLGDISIERSKLTCTVILTLEEPTGIEVLANPGLRRARSNGLRPTVYRGSENSNTHPGRSHSRDEHPCALPESVSSRVLYGTFGAA